MINHSLKLISIKGVEFIMIYYEKLTKSGEREREKTVTVPSLKKKEKIEKTKQGRKLHDSSFYLSQLNGIHLMYAHLYDKN